MWWETGKWRQAPQALFFKGKYPLCLLIREELVAFGVDVGPITATTRGLWLKKLDKLNAEKRKNRRSLKLN